MHSELHLHFLCTTLIITDPLLVITSAELFWMHHLKTETNFIISMISNLSYKMYSM